MKFITYSRVKLLLVALCAGLLLCAASTAFAESQDYVIEFTTYEGGGHDVVTYDAATGREIEGGYVLSNYDLSAPMQFIINPNGCDGMNTTQVILAYRNSYQTWNSYLVKPMLVPSVRVSTSAKFANDGRNTISFEEIPNKPNVLARTTAYVRAYSDSSGHFVNRYAREVDMRISPSKKF